MSSSMGNVLAYGGCLALAAMVAVAYWIGRRNGARDANRQWTIWTGIEAHELKSRQYDRELRELRRRIGRPADEWPEETREDY